MRHLFFAFCLLVLGLLENTNAQGRQINGDRVILVTGSTSGLGREVARALVDQGAHVIIHGRSRERGEALEKELNEKRANSSRFYAADFGSFAAIKAFADQLTTDYDRLDVLVNNAFRTDDEIKIETDSRAY